MTLQINCILPVILNFCAKLLKMEVICIFLSWTHQIFILTPLASNTNNLIVVNRSPLLAAFQDSPRALTLCSANVRSAKSKSADLLDFIYNSDADLFTFTETWLSDKDTAAKLEFIPPGTHKFLHHSRLGCKGRGTGLLFKENIDVKKIDAGEKTSFEYSD